MQIFQAVPLSIQDVSKPIINYPARLNVQTSSSANHWQVTVYDYFMSPSPTRSTAMIFIVGFVLLLILGSGLYLTKVVLLGSPSQLPEGTFFSALEQRSYWDEKLQKTIYYWVLETSNKSSSPYYSCRFDLVSKGAQDIYEGFFKNYTLRNCHLYSSLRPNYDCRLENSWKKYTQYASARQLRKFPPSSSSELAVSRFYLEDQTQQTQSFSAKNSLSDIYSYQISCRTSAGRPVIYVQTF